MRCNCLFPLWLYVLCADYLFVLSRLLFALRGLFVCVTRFFVCVTNADFLRSTGFLFALRGLFVCVNYAGFLFGLRGLFVAFPRFASSDLHFSDSLQRTDILTTIFVIFHLRLQQELLHTDTDNCHIKRSQGFIIFSCWGFKAFHKRILIG